MQKNIFFVSPFGEKDTERRVISDSIFNEFTVIFEQMTFLNPYTPENSKRIDFRIGRSDHLPNVNIVKTMLEQLEKADIVIVDITGLNPNVMYELGLRIGMEKPVLIIRDSSESTEEIPYNISGIRIIYFDLNSDKGKKRFKDELKSQIDNFLQDQSIFIYHKAKSIYKLERDNLGELSETKGKCNGSMKLSWIIKEWQVERLFDYFKEEKDIVERNTIPICRLINTMNIDEETIIKHVMLFKELIQSGQYKIYSTKREDYEIHLYNGIRSQINENICFVLFPDYRLNINTLGIVLYDQKIINAIDNRYNKDIEKGSILEINQNSNDNEIRNTVINWINVSNNNSNNLV